MKKRFLAATMAGLLLVSAAGCGGDQGDPGAVKIATKPMTEQYILGEMLGALIEDAGYRVEITKGIGGGTSNIQPAMEKGDFDLYPEYTSTGYVMVLGHDANGATDDEIWQTLQTEYHDRFQMAWVGQYGFNNTFTVAVRTPVAEQYGIKTCSDLGRASGKLVFGGNPDYNERADGLSLLCKTYGMDFKGVRDVDIGLKYIALASGDIDVTNAFTTDAQLAVADVVTLEDDLHLQVNYFCATVVREDALEKFPGLEDALKKMEGILTDQEMAALNYKVEVEEQNERDVAREFLTAKGLLEA